MIPSLSLCIGKFPASFSSPFQHAVPNAFHTHSNSYRHIVAVFHVVVFSTDIKCHVISRVGSNADTQQRELKSVGRTSPVFAVEWSSVGVICPNLSPASSR